MNDSEFIALADQTLKQLELALETCGADLDCSMTGNGVLEIEFDDGGNHRHGIVPVDITATGSHAALPGTAMDVGRVEWLAALRAKVDRHRKYP